MDARTRDKRRSEISHCRRRPVKPQRIYFPAQGIGELVEVQPAKPLELCIETTDTEGNVVPWLTDEWWIRTHAFCKDRTVTIVILPTPRSLLDTVVLYQLEMVRRIAPKWRILGYARMMDARAEPNVELWVNTPYDEIRFCEIDADSTTDATSAAQELANRAAAIVPPRGFHYPRVCVTGTIPYQHLETVPESSTPHPASPPPVEDRLLSANVVQSS